MSYNEEVIKNYKRCKIYSTVLNEIKNSSIDYNYYESKPKKFRTAQTHLKEDKLITIQKTGYSPNTLVITSEGEKYLKSLNELNNIISSYNKPSNVFEELKKSNKRLEKFKIKYKDMEQVLNQKENNKNQIRHQIKDYQQKFVEFDQDFSSISRISFLKKKDDKLIQKLTVLENELKQKEKNKKEIQTQIDNLFQEKVRLESQIKVLKRANQSIEEQIISKNERTKTLKDLIPKKEKEIDLFINSINLNQLAIIERNNCQTILTNIQIVSDFVNSNERLLLEFLFNNNDRESLLQTTNATIEKLFENLQIIRDDIKNRTDLKKEIPVEICRVIDCLISQGKNKFNNQNQALVNLYSVMLFLIAATQQLFLLNKILNQRRFLLQLLL